MFLKDENQLLGIYSYIDYLADIPPAYYLLYFFDAKSLMDQETLSEHVRKWKSQLNELPVHNPTDEISKRDFIGPFDNLSSIQQFGEIVKKELKNADFLLFSVSEFNVIMEKETQITNFWEVCRKAKGIIGEYNNNFHPLLEKKSSKGPLSWFPFF